MDIQQQNVSFNLLLLCYRDTYERSHDSKPENQSLNGSLCLCEKRPHLEPIQEESEQEDELEGSKTRESEDEDFQIQVGVETKTIMADDKSEEDEDDSALLRVLRPRRLSHSHSQDSIPQMQFTTNQQEKVENFSLSDWKSHTVGLSDEATPPKQARLRNNKRSTSDELRIKVGLSFWHNLHSD